MNSGLILVRGGGDLATGTIHRLWSAGFPVLVIEAERPAAIRRQVSLCEAVYDGEAVVEGMRGVRIERCEEAWGVIDRGDVPVLVDPVGESIRELGPEVVIDAIIAKKNLGTHRGLAPFTVAASIPGIIRGLLREGYPVTEGFKIADIDPRKEELANCFTISDKARCIAGSVLEVVVSHYFHK